MDQDDGTNPKDRAARCKPDPSCIPPTAILHLAVAHMDGAAKYGAFNWRKRPVSARVYVGAALRHLLAYLDGEDVAEDSGAHHLAHMMACGAILLDAEEVGTLIDDRPKAGPGGALAERLRAEIETRQTANWLDGWRQDRRDKTP